jgi:hypothetical protein
VDPKQGSTAPPETKQSWVSMNAGEVHLLPIVIGQSNPSWPTVRKDYPAFDRCLGEPGTHSSSIRPDCH